MMVSDKFEVELFFLFLVLTLHKAMLGKERYVTYVRKMRG